MRINKENYKNTDYNTYNNKNFNDDNNINTECKLLNNKYDR